MAGRKKEINEGGGDSEEDSIADGKIFKLTGILLPNALDIRHPCLGRTPMAPLNHLFDLPWVTLKDSLYATISPVSDPAFQA